jgi:hypothetical protein
MGRACGTKLPIKEMEVEWGGGGDKEGARPLNSIIINHSHPDLKEQHPQDMYAFYFVSLSEIISENVFSEIHNIMREHTPVV